MSNSGTSRPWHGLVYGDGGTGVAGGGFCLSTTTKTELMEEVGSVPPEVESTSKHTVITNRTSKRSHEALRGNATSE